MYICIMYMYSNPLNERNWKPEYGQPVGDTEGNCSRKRKGTIGFPVKAFFYPLRGQVEERETGHVELV